MNQISFTLICFGFYFLALIYLPVRFVGSEKLIGVKTPLVIRFILAWVLAIFLIVIFRSGFEIPIIQSLDTTPPDESGYMFYDGTAGNAFSLLLSFVLPPIAGLIAKIW